MTLLEKIKRPFGIVESSERQKDVHWQTWFDEQLRKLDADEEIEPPWIAFPNSLPLGWNQGYQQEWKNNVWLLFWRRMNEEKQENYFNRWQPSEEWRETLTIYWIGDN